MSHVNRHLFIEYLHFSQLVEEAASVDALHDDEVMIAVLHELEDASDIWMLGLFQNLQLALIKILEIIGQ